MFKLRNLLTVLALAVSVVVLPSCGKKCAKDSMKKEHHRKGRKNSKKMDRKERDRNFLFKK